MQAVTGVAVTRIERKPEIGAGGTCVNFAAPDGQAYLGVNRLDTEGQYAASVAAVPEDVYPTREPITGVGDEAVLLKGPGGTPLSGGAQRGAGGWCSSRWARASR